MPRSAYCQSAGAAALDRLAWLLQGLDQVHSQGIVHNDVKPTNCLLKTENRELVLADLGSSSYVSGLHCPLMALCGHIKS